MRLRITTALLAATLALTACGGDDDSDASTDEPAAEPADQPAADEPAAEPPAEPSGGGSGTATLTLANGEAFEFDVLCALEPQMAAGSEILFSVVSYDNPSLDITQFGDDGTVQGLATVSVYDADTYDSLWDAQTTYEAFGGTIELSLDGSIVSGSASFYPAADIGAEPVQGEFEARC